MTTTPIASNAGTWSEESVQDALQIIAEGLTELVGFGSTVISVRRRDDLVVVALAGAENGRRAADRLDSVDEVLGACWPVARLRDLLDVADDWGWFKFIRHDRARRVSWIWVREAGDVEGQDAWHPNDGALAPIHDAAGELVGAISVDAPRTGRYPDAAQRRVMDKYAAQAAQVVLAALEREAFERRLRLAEGARQLVRTASRHLSLGRLLDETGPAFREAFAASGLWLVPHGSAEALGSGTRHQLLIALPTEELSVAVSTATDRLWERRLAATIYADGRTDNPVLEEPDAAAARRLVRSEGFGSVLYAPIGAGEECLGSLILARHEGQPDWSSIELEQAAEVGRDLGRIIRNGQTYSRVQELVRELRALDAHKSRLIAMVSHELKNPLTVLLANRDLLEPELDDEATLTHLADVDANAQRMCALVDNLLLLSKLADPDTPHVEQDVDLGCVLGDVRTTLAASMGQRGVSLRITTPQEPLVVSGDNGELRTMLANLVENGIKFSHDGGSVEVAATVSPDRIEVVVADHGIGISGADQEQLFSDFFRSQDPAAATRPGSGLGLAIVDRILRRHGGRAEMTSILGEGTTVRVHLPRPGFGTRS